MQDALNPENAPIPSALYLSLRHWQGCIEDELAGALFGGKSDLSIVNPNNVVIDYELRILKSQNLDPLRKEAFELRAQIRVRDAAGLHWLNEKLRNLVQLVKFMHFEEGPANPKILKENLDTKGNLTLHARRFLSTVARECDLWCVVYGRLFDGIAEYDAWLDPITGAVEVGWCWRTHEQDVGVPSLVISRYFTVSDWEQYRRLTDCLRRVADVVGAFFPRTRVSVRTTGTWTPPPRK